jgi:hypothetical protein
VLLQEPLKAAATLICLPIQPRRCTILTCLRQCPRLPGERPLVAVEISMATHNGERFLRDQLESLFAQTYGGRRQFRAAATKMRLSNAALAARNVLSRAGPVTLRQTDRRDAARTDRGASALRSLERMGGRLPPGTGPAERAEIPGGNPRGTERYMMQEL